MNDKPFKNIRYGKLVTCPRCKKELFLEETDETVMDGGYTRTRNHEPIPDEWKHLTVIDQTGFFCPRCVWEYNNRLSGFYKL